MDVATPRAEPVLVDDQRSRTIRTVALASLIGTTIEWYDFILYGTMAGLVLNRQYFPVSDPTVSTILAYASFATGFLTRPLGGIVFGHFGDRLGRKPLLVLTLTLMGIATFLIGLVPTYASIGLAAPAMLLALRLLQGFAFGGEWGGAVLMTFEYAPREKRGFYASFPQMGIATGLCLASGVVALLSYLLTEAQFQAWGWRVAFLLSAGLLVVGVFIRLSVVETPAFRGLKTAYQVAKVPLAEIVREFPGSVVLGWGARLVDGITFAVYSLFVIPYFTGVLGISRTLTLSGITISALLLVVTIPTAAAWSDRVGRRRFYAAASLVSGIAAFPVFYLMHESGSPAVAVGALVVALGVLWAPIYGPQAALFCELFSTRVRYTGISLVYQIAAIFSVSITPAIATYLLEAGGRTPWLIAAYIFAAGLVSAASALLIRRTF